MRLLNTRTLEIHEFQGDDENRRYAILSHTWGDDECTLQHMSISKASLSTREGYKKIRYCCEQAVKDGLEWAWVDTCCIDKTSTAELSEAINSMFRWYRDATTCYAYLVDVASVRELSSSRWFTRGFTLQELIAPKVVQFYSVDWIDLGSKLDLQDEIEEITGIEKSVLSTCEFDRVCIAKRMSWAANRKTTRVEDMAYSLMGIFGVNMPLLYGEGTRSFIRLQEEIMKISDDHTLFAWGLPANFKDMDRLAMQSWSNGTQQSDSPQRSQLHGLLASAPSDFETKHDLRPLQLLQPDLPPIMSSNGVRIELPVWSKTKLPYQFAAISCYIHGYNTKFLGIPLRRWDERYTARCGPLVLLSEADWSARAKETLLIKQPPTLIPSLPNPSSFKVVRSSKDPDDYWILDEIHCLGEASYSDDTQTIDFPADQQGPHAALFFSKSVDLDHRLDMQFQSHIKTIFGDQAYEEEGLSVRRHRYKLKHLSRLKRYDPSFNSYLDEVLTVVPAFAIILGSDTKPWAAFVRIDNGRKHFKTQLQMYLDGKNGLNLNDKKGLNLDKQDHLDQILHYLIGTRVTEYIDIGRIQKRPTTQRLGFFWRGLMH